MLTILVLKILVLENIKAKNISAKNFSVKNTVYVLFVIPENIKIRTKNHVTLFLLSRSRDFLCGFSGITNSTYNVLVLENIHAKTETPKKTH